VKKSMSMAGSPFLINVHNIVIRKAMPIAMATAARLSAIRFFHFL
jgi:hypothetical protein